MPVIAKNANGMLFFPKNAGTEMIIEKIATAITALNGTRSRLTRRKIVQPGIPRSRENAYHVREALVSPAAPQKIWPLVAMMNTILAAHGSIELVKIAPGKPSASLTAPSSVAANRKASSTNHPITADRATDRHTP